MVQEAAEEARVSDLMHLDFRPDEGSDASILDEFVITGAHGIHAEMMNDKHLWIGIENEAGHLVHVNIRAERKGGKTVLRMRAEDQGVHPRKVLTDTKTKGSETP